MSFEQPNGYTGGLLEEELLGACDGWKNKEYMPYADALEFVKAHQPEGWRPSDPRPRFAADLFTTVALALLGPEGDWTDLKFYTAVDSPLDVFHGTDAFFEYQDKIIKIDLTINPQKGDAKADFIINPDKDDLEVVADGIVDFIKRLDKKKAA